MDSSVSESVLDKVYIHYGSPEFEESEFDPIENEFEMVGFLWYKFPLPKCDGGLWASPESSKFGWEWFCTTNKHENWESEYEEGGSFKFKLRDNSRVLFLSKFEQLETIPIHRKDEMTEYKKFIPFFLSKDYPDLPDLETLQPGEWILHALDFQEIMKNYDAIEFDYANSDQKMRLAMYTWDCDCIFVLNKDVIVPIEEIN